MMKQILSELPLCRKNLVDKFRSIFIDTELAEYISTITSVDDCQPIIELLLLEEGARLTAFLEAFKDKPEKLHYIFQDSRVLEKISSQRELIIDKASVRDALAACTVTHPELGTVTVHSSFDEFVHHVRANGNLVTLFQGVPPRVTLPDLKGSPGLPIDPASTETPSSFLKRRFAVEKKAPLAVEPSAPLLSSFGFFALATAATAALAATTVYGIGKMRTSS